MKWPDESVGSKQVVVVIIHGKSYGMGSSGDTTSRYPTDSPPVAAVVSVVAQHHVLTLRYSYGGEAVVIVRRCRSQHHRISGVVILFVKKSVAFTLQIIKLLDDFSIQLDVGGRFPVDVELVVAHGDFIPGQTDNALY